MCDANMKSEFLVTDRYKGEARTTRGRKMSKVALQSLLLVNGDGNKEPGGDACESAAAAAVGLEPVSSESGGQGDAKSVPLPPFELDHMYACGGGGGGGDGQQMKYMKDLLLLHLDLIQQQQGQLAARDQKIAALRRDNNTLQKRLEEANNRVAAFERGDHQRRRNFQHTKDGSTSFLDFGRQRKSTSLSGDWRRKRTSSSDSFQFKSHSTPSSSRGDACGSQSVSKSSGKCKQQPFSSSSATSHKNFTSQPKPKEREAVRDSVLLTDIMYYTPVGEALRCADTWTSSVFQEEQVLVPTWRIRPITSCYQMEGTENLDDDIFLKRHQKLEIDEKRRKRWDIQRLREQRLQEKLKRGRGGCNKETLGNRSPELNTFYPRVEEVEEVEVSEIIPVSAFGYSIPLIETEEFCVPWLS